MGFLKGYNNIASAARHFPGMPTKKAVEAFQIKLFNLISEAHATIRTPDTDSSYDEVLISVSLFNALEIIASRDDIPVSITPERHEITKQISDGTISAMTSKRYDVYFENWDAKKRIKFGVEAKLLVENNFQTKIASTLVSEYVSDKGMGKYINGIYKERGCMVGYVIEGQIPNIINKINVLIDKNLSEKDRLNKIINKKITVNDLYSSDHTGKLDYSLFHLILPFN